MSQPTPFTVLTNSFAITRVPTKIYYMYDIAFSPPVKEGPKRNQLFHHLQTTVKPATFNPRLVYDGHAIAYSPGRMNLGGSGGATFCIMLGKNDEQSPVARGAVQIRITLTSSEAIRPADVSDTTEHRKITQRSVTATNLMQLIVRQGPNQNNTNNGRAYFTGNDRLVITGAGIELWGGIYQSVRPTLGRMILTVDTSTAAVYQSGQLIDVMMDFLNFRNVQDLQLAENHPNYKKLEKFLKKLRIKVLSGTGGKRSRIKSIRGIVPAGGNYTFYKESEGEEVTVAQHFHKAYELRMQYPKIIGISLSGKKDSGADIVPAEFCTVERGQLYRHKIPEHVTPAMVKFATLRPRERLNKIVAGAAHYNRSEFVVESEMRVDTNPMELRATILAEQRIMYGNRVTMNVNNGAWNVLKKQLYVAAAIESWAMVNFCGDKFRMAVCEGFMNELWKCCSELGMRVAAPHGVYNVVGHNVWEQLDGVMGEIFKKTQNPELVAKVNLMIILPQNAAPIRTEVKRWGDIKHGIATFCVREGKVAGAKNQYFNNVALKLNARNGGTNCRGVSPAMEMLKNEPFIIMGADVGHPGPGVPKPSITSLVYSHDTNATQYVALSGVQAPRTEIIADLRQYVRTAVDTWGAKNQTAPVRIFFFRDGVSEGEFAKVAQEEIKEIKGAIDDVWELRKIKANKPLLTFIVVGKRHHAVFFPKPGDERHSDKTGNCRAGSVFDSDEITHPALDDFYLQSHSAIIGTCRSSHYIVLLNENRDRFPLPAIQELAYTLCHNYAKATRSVSIPAPVYYADLVCARGPFHVDPSATLNFDDGMSASSGQTTFDLASWRSAYLPINRRLEKTMYFL